MNIRNIIKTSVVIITIISSASCRQSDQGFSRAEKMLIESSDSIMRVLTVEDSLDLAVLRNTSSNLSSEALLSDEFQKLSHLMLATVTHPSQDGVGIAAPQVGINRRIVAVQRFDKEGRPFEIYPNIRIIAASDSLSLGSEGCLSVPGRRGKVLRAKEIVIEYTQVPKDTKTIGHPGSLPSVRDTVKGFTAVIFQHETDHLDGVLYTDRIGN